MSRLRGGYLGGGTIVRLVEEPADDETPNARSAAIALEVREWRATRLLAPEIYRRCGQISEEAGEILASTRQRGLLPDDATVRLSKLRQECLEMKSAADKAGVSLEFQKHGWSPGQCRQWIGRIEELIRDENSGFSNYKILE